MGEQTDESAALMSELAEALSGALTNRPQRCGHSSDPLCCPYENFPTLAAFFDPDEDPEATCGRDDGYGRCGLPRDHREGLHAVLIGGGADPVADPEVWFVFGDVKKPTYRVLSLCEADEFDPADFPPGMTTPPTKAADQ